MLSTHIFLVILVTVILIVFAESQQLRKVTWILLISCITYIILIIIPEKSVPVIIEQEVQNSPKEIDIIDETTFDKPINNEKIVSDQPPSTDKIQNLGISTIAIAKDIVDKTPVGVSRLFLNDIDTLYCFTVVDNTSKNNVIIHNWKRYEKDYTYEQDFFRSIIKVGDSPNWRCWSKITIKPEMTGDWKVIVTDSIGNQLDSIEFSIIPAKE
ncbi:MAG: DUF2914 domain-containing protein [Planctomycetia bacterium]|nr:DUF2914 domain-containing protein [Planctomycetia bacterium]